MKVLVVGAGPAGLAAAIALRRSGVRDVIALDREPEAGGVPRHCDHVGFGLRDLHRVLGGPAYARRYATMAVRAGVDVRAEATAIDWTGPTSLRVTSPQGLETIAADAVLLATGCRERPRSARLVPGTRPAGIFTTGSLQQLVHLGHERIGRVAVVVGAEHVSFSAVLTLAEAGCATAAMITEHPQHQTYAPLAWWAAGRRGVPILGSARVVDVHGRERVQGVTLGDGRTIGCDTLVFTGDWIPDHELAHRGGVPLDRRSRGPAVDHAGRTRAPGVFAAGNVVHAAETADLAALHGRAAADAIRRYLDDGAWPSAPVALLAEADTAWVWPNAVATDVRGEVRLRVGRWIERGRIEVVQDERTLWRSGVRALVPARSIRLPAAALARVDAGGGPVRIVTHP